jgi:glycosyltransferase involved in cell wall biosynthesis
MRILMVTPSYYPIVGGTETYVEQLTQKLNEKGVKADILTLNMASKWNPVGRDERGKTNGAMLFRISAHNPRLFNFHNHSIYGELFNVHVIPRMSFAKEFDHYDVVHFHDDTDFTFPLFSYLTLKKSKPRLWHLHTIPYTYRLYERNPLLKSVIGRIADRYIGLSKYTIPFMLKLGLPESKLAIIPNAIDTAKFRPNKKMKTDNLILSVGRIIFQKGFDVLLKALFQLEPPTQVAIVGPIGDKLFFSEIQRLIRKVNDTTVHKVSYLGPLSGNALVELYQKAAIFAAPARTDHFPMANLEALACGTPVIATPTGAVPDVIEDRRNGLLVPSDEPTALASALNMLLKDGKLRQSCGERGRDTVERKFSWTVVSEKVIEIYDRLLTIK